MSRTIVCAIIVGLLILESRKCSSIDNPDDIESWKTALVYEIWPASFQDSNGDGIGDLQGIINRLDYINDLGVDIVCLNPIFKSPLVDSGFDVSDYYKVNPIFGDLEDFDRLVNETHQREMELILDVVPNYTSDEHPWFEASKRMEEPYTDYYVWANGTVLDNGTRLDPDNWISIRNDSERSSWSYNDDRDQWYHHIFHEREPHLNLDNPSVSHEIMNYLEFWLNRDVDGFRITRVPYFFMVENVKLLSDIRNSIDEWSSINGAEPKYLIAASSDTAQNLLAYYGNSSQIDLMPSNYNFIDDDAISGSNATELRMDIENWLNSIPLNTSTNWMLSTRDSGRITSKIGSDRLDALIALSMLLPGRAFTYFGDEIGMKDPPTLEDSTDSVKPDNHISSYENLVRSPMQWDDSSPTAGFTTKTIPLVTPPNPDYVDVNVAEQLEEPRSHLNVYKKLAKLRKDLVFSEGDWELRAVNDESVLVLRRRLMDHPVYLVIVNLADTPQTMNMTELYPEMNEYLDVLVDTDNENGEESRAVVLRNGFNLSSNSGLVLKSNRSDDGDFTAKMDDDEESAPVTTGPEVEEEDTDEEQNEDETGSNVEETGVTEEDGMIEEKDEEEIEDEEKGKEETEDEEKNKEETENEEKVEEEIEDKEEDDKDEYEEKEGDQLEKPNRVDNQQNTGSSWNKTPLARMNLIVGIILVHTVLIKIS